MDTHKISITSPQQIHTLVTGVVPGGKPVELNEVAVLLHAKIL